MILSGNAIRQAISKGLLKIEPFIDEQIKAAHVELYLDGSEPLTVPPKTFLTASTKEKITVAATLCGFLEGRTSLAKQGISVEQSSTFIQPGSGNQMLLEIFNASDAAVTLPLDQPIAKMILARVVDEI